MGFFNSVPSYYRTCSFPVRNGVFYQGATQQPQVILSGAGATGYEVRDYSGTVVSSGAVSGTTVAPAQPSGGWLPGWYRIYFTGPTVDPVVGTAVAVTNFCVIRDDAHFPPMPALPSRFFEVAEYADPIAKAVMGLGTTRVIIPDYRTVNESHPGLGFPIPKAQEEIAASKAYWSSPAVQYQDTARPPRLLWCATPGDVADVLRVSNGAGGVFLALYPKTESVDGSQVFVATSAGTSVGSKVQVYAPDATTLAETYDNLTTATAAASAINAASTRVKAFSGDGAGAVTMAAAAIGRGVWNGVVQVVQTLYPDVTRYECTNEISLGAEAAHAMRLFQAAVHAGNAGAKAIGPCPVSVSYWDNWRQFFAAGGGTYSDEISFHDYGCLGPGSLTHGRSTMETLTALLAEYGLSSKTLWQTEAGGAFSAVYGVHHPRRARVKILHTLLWEQYGVPRERNPMWYDVSHGFWSFPMWWQYGDTSLTADAPIHRVLAEETWGLNHSAKLDFGAIGNNLLMGSVYSGASGKRAVLIAASHVPGLTVTLATSATGTVTVVDAFGRASTVAVAGGMVTVPVGDVPTYVRLGASDTVSVHRVSDWPTASEQGAWVTGSTLAQPTGLSSGTHGDALTDGVLETVGNTEPYAGYGSDAGNGDAGMPDSVTLRWDTASRFDRVILWGGGSFSGRTSLLDFDIQTSNDGTTWTTRATVTRAPSSFLFGSSSANTWCTRETYWDEQWVHDVKLPAPVTAKFLRVYVRATSYGGEPDLPALQAGGQGWYQRITLYDVSVMCDDNVRPQFVVNLP